MRDLPGGTVTLSNSATESGQRGYLSQLALVRARAGECETAGRIWGSVEAANAFIPGGPWPRDFERLDLAVSQLADEAFRRGHEEGRALSLEDVAASVSP